MKDETEAQKTLLHAIDLALLRDWGRAKSLAESIDSPVGERLFLLLAAIEEREAARLRRFATVRHEVGNALSIAQANLEAIVDGLLQPTEERLNALLSALGSASNVLDTLRRTDGTIELNDPPHLEEVDLFALVDANISSLERLATSKDVTIQHARQRAPGETVTCSADGVSVGRVVHEALLAAIRSTPPRGFIEVDCPPGGTALSLQLHDGAGFQDLPVLKAILRDIGSNVRIDTTESGEHLLVIALPLAPQKPQP